MRTRKAASRHAGWEDGYRAGWLEGRRLGACEAIALRTRFDAPVRELRILYIRTGLWSYAPLDEGIIDALRGLVREVHVLVPTDDAVSLAAGIRPDLVLSLNSVECFGLGQVDALREMGIRTAAWFADDPYFIDVTKNIAPHYDYVFTLDEACVPVYRERGCPRVFHIPLGANTAIYAPKRVEAGAAGPDICFIGSAFRNRAAFFDRIAAYLKGKSVLIAGYWWERMANFGMLEDKIRNGHWLSPHETASYYNRAKIVINMHRAIDDDTNQNVGLVPALSVNPRSFEIGACAAFQLTDRRHGLASAFEPGAEIATYDLPEELIEKADYYLNREEERRDIALRGYGRTMREHTYPRRVAQLLDAVFG
ncbi:CgeB family protein [Paenibacillus sp. GYB003]|uniref:CgeB family protein n=1 Tax=Paenibacillus sp. GYB003 TaxID=2994392 RepID=UPI002F96D047